MARAAGAPIARHRFRCAVHGLTIACDAPPHVTGLSRAAAGDRGAPPDVLVDWLGPIALPARHPPLTTTHRIVEPTGGWLAISPSPGPGADGARLRFGLDTEHVEFDIAPDAKRLSVAWTPGVLPGHVATLLLTTVTGYLLHVHRRLALHAGLVAWRGAAFAVAGARGAGKSTLVGALLQRGCAALGDDLAAPIRRPGGWAVWPGPAGIRLARDARMALGLPAAAGAPLWPPSPSFAGADGRLGDRTVVSLAGTPGSAAGSGPLPLAGIFLLAPRGHAATPPGVRALPAAMAVARLAEHVRTPAWLAAAMDARRFAELADLARRTPVFTVQRPDALAALPAVCDVVLAEMERLRR